MILSIGDLVDKLIIENIKIFNLREKIHGLDVSDDEYVANSNKMNLLNKNRSILSICLDDKVDKVIAKQEENCVLKVVKTYEGKK